MSLFNYAIVCSYSTKNRKCVSEFWTKFYSSNALETLKPKYKAVLACLPGALMGGIHEKMEDENLATRYTRKHVKRLIPVWPT